MFKDNPGSFGQRLRALRKELGCDSPEHLRKLLKGEYSVSAILKRERGEIKLDRQYILDFCRALNVSPEVKRQLLAVLDVFRVQFDPWRKHHESFGSQHFEYWDRVRNSKVYRQFEPMYACLFLQTERYAYEGLRSFGVEHLAAKESAALRWAMGQHILRGRASAAAKVLNSNSKLPRLVLVQDEEALYRVAGSHAVMKEQVEYLVSISSRLDERVDVRILPRLCRAPIPLGYNFNLYDEILASMETISGNVFVTDLDNMSMLLSWFDKLVELSKPLSHPSSQKILKRALEIHERN